MGGAEKSLTGEGRQACPRALMEVAEDQVILHVESPDRFIMVWQTQSESEGGERDEQRE